VARAVERARAERAVAAAPPRLARARQVERAALAVPAALIGAVRGEAAGAAPARLAEARAVGAHALAVALRAARTAPDRAVVPRVPVGALARVVDAPSVQRPRAVVGAGAHRARGAGEALEAVARAVVAVAVVRAVVLARAQRAVVPREARVAAASQVGAHAVPAAVIGADRDRAVVARVAHRAAALAVEALAARGAVVGTARQRAGRRVEALVALTHAIVAHAAAVAVFGAARARLDPGHERGEDRGEERGVASQARHSRAGREPSPRCGALWRNAGATKNRCLSGGKKRELCPSAALLHAFRTGEAGAALRSRRRSELPQGG